MNEFQKTLYNNLMLLVEKNEAFYFSDQEIDEEQENDDTWYRIFNYRLASYSDFCEPDALECRGVMFEMKNQFDPEPIRLASLPFEKFFNYNENPFTMNLDLSEIVEIADKADGSLITSFLHDGKLRLKSKGSLHSQQAQDALEWLRMPENNEFRNEILTLDALGYTVIMEWCSPYNRIVLNYENSHLKVLGIRSRENGSYVEYDDLDKDYFPEIAKRWVKIIETDDPVKYIESVDDMQGVEGVVFRLKNGQRVKKKSKWYLALHHTKDSINTPRRLYEAVIEEATDDMRSLFYDDPVAIKLIDEMEQFVEKHYNHLVDTVERFYERNKNLERKEYAILGQSELTKLQFGLAMQKYTGKEINYKEVMKKRWKEFGFKDEKVIDNE